MVTSADPYYLLNGVLAPIVLGLGLMTSLEDVRSGKIPNRWLLGALALAAGFFGAIFLEAKRPGGSLVFREAVGLWTGEGAKWVVNVLLSVLFAVVLWKKKIWGGGDAKLFIIYSLILPIAWYRLIYFNGYGSFFLLLLTTFVPAALYIFLRAVSRLICEIIRHPFITLPWLFREAKEYLTRTKIRSEAFVFLRLLVFCYCLRLLSPYWVPSGLGGVRADGAIWFAMLIFYRVLSRVAQHSLLVMLALFLSAAAVLSIPQSPVLGRDLEAEALDSFKLAVLFSSVIPLGTWLVTIYVKKFSHPGVRFATWMFMGVVIVWGLRFL